MLMGKVKKKLQKTGIYQYAVKKYRIYLLKKEFYTQNNVSKGNEVVFVFDKSFPHPGLVDRLKAIVCIYYIAKQSGRKFKIYNTTSLHLENYLQPSGSNDWRCEPGDVTWNKNKVKFFEYRPFEIIPKLSQSKKQYHCWYYSGHNILQESGVEDWEKIWSDLYHELFTPNEYLSSKLRESIPLEPFIAVHFRFVNALEKFEDGYESSLNAEEQLMLIQDSLKKIKEIERKENKKLLLFADSERFLNIAEKEGITVLGSTNIGHVSFSEDRAVYDKVFIDFYTMAAADRVYCVRGKRLYNSVFPMYAAIVGGHEYLFDEMD